jgi:uncharacterized protein YyaL (SSP411 family)
MPNALINETSPYLLQHANNPVNWYPWNVETLQRAKDENKPMIISIGYAACHWCHVMEHESFENESVAKIMNANFICIKVDREERPDVDQIYMNAVQLLSGRGGWPLNAFALPDARPFYAGTYYPKDNWISLLERIQHLFKSDIHRLKEQATAITNGIIESDQIAEQTNATEFKSEDFSQIVEHFIHSFDSKFGGFGSSPKFPMPVDYQFLLSALYYTKDDRIASMLGMSLDKMAIGGIFDQVGGGFYRYSVDSYWKIPHFEKMLYDNGQLLELFANAYHYTKKEIYRSIVMRTVDFIKREMISEEGGIYSALDADSEGEEGKYYVWSDSELKSVLGDDYTLLSDIYDFKLDGNWEHGNNVFHQWEDDTLFSEKHKIDESDIIKIKENAFTKLLQIRNNRIRPGLDDKQLLAWNAMCISGLVAAGNSLNDNSYIELAVQSMDFLRKNFIRENGEVFRTYKNGNAKIIGFLEDHAFLISACIDLYQSTFNIDYLNLAKSQTDYVVEHFQNVENGFFYFTSDRAEKLVARKMELSDNVIPASNSQMALNLIRLSYFYDDPSYRDMSKKMISSMSESVIKHGRFYSNWAKVMLWHVYPPIEIAILGENALDLRLQFNDYYTGHTLFLGGTEDNLPLLQSKYVKGQNRIYVCHNKTCQQPVESITEALKQI